MKKLIVILLAFNVIPALCQESYRVMTYNIKYDDKNDQVNGWNLRKDELVGLIQYHHPLVLGTQEGLKNQLDYMKEKLSGYDYVGVARDDGKEKGEYSAIFYHTGKFNLVQQETFWLSPTPEKPSKGWDAALPRVCTWALLEDKGSGFRFYVFNAHFDHIGVKAREQSIAVILEKVKSLAGNHPVIVMGDFNFDPEKAPYAIATAVLNDSRKISKTAPYGPEETFNGFAFDKRPEKRIDYVFVNGKFEVLNYATLSDSNDLRYPSDHFPVIVTVALKK